MNKFVNHNALKKKKKKKEKLEGNDRISKGPEPQQTAGHRDWILTSGADSPGAQLTLGEIDEHLPNHALL